MSAVIKCSESRDCRVVAEQIATLEAAIERWIKLYREATERAELAESRLAEFDQGAGGMLAQVARLEKDTDAWRSMALESRERENALRKDLAAVRLRMAFLAKRAHLYGDGKRVTGMMIQFAADGQFEALEPAIDAALAGKEPHV